MAGHFVSTPVSGFHTVLEPANFWNQGPLVNGVCSWQLIIKHDMTCQFHGQTLGVRPSVRFHISALTDAEPAHFWSQGPLVNGVRSWLLIIKYDLTHRFHGRTLGVRPSVRVPHRSGHRCGTGPLLEERSTCEWCQKLAIDYKT